MTIALALVLIAADAPVDTAAPVERMGRVVRLDGAPERKARGTDTWGPLGPGEVLHEGDTVRTGVDARLRILMDNRSVVDLGPDTQIRLRDIQGEPARRRVGLLAIIGRIWARVAPGGGENRFEVETQNAVAGVRGTSFFMEVDPEGNTDVTVSAGAVEMSGQAVAGFRIGPRERGSIRADGSHQLRKDLTKASLAQLRSGVAVKRQLRGKAGARRLGAMKKRLASGDRKLSPGAARRVKRALAKGQRRRAFRRLAMGDVDPETARRLFDRLRSSLAQ